MLAPSLVSSIHSLPVDVSTALEQPFDSKAARVAQQLTSNRSIEACRGLSRSDVFVFLCRKLFMLWRMLIMANVLHLVELTRQLSSGPARQASQHCTSAGPLRPYCG
eukprot:GHUV01036125.1.p1 GENE.GHUV01036125.1~~GHUV01036125.1.p1  ORF type:complete len:107 (-),score=18.44 GHUV01036125.1:1-321(-)